MYMLALGLVLIAVVILFPAASLESAGGGGTIRPGG